MLRFIRQLVQKLKKEPKVEARVTSRHNNGNTLVSGSQSPVSPEATFANCKLDYPVDVSLYENYIKRRSEFDKKFEPQFKSGFLSRCNYRLWKHYYALGVVGW